MATIQIKRSTGGNVPGSNLAAGELAYAFGTSGTGPNTLFLGSGTANLVVGGKKFTDMLDHTAGTLTLSSAIITDANSKIDTLKLKGADNSTPGNIVLDENDGTYATTLKGAASLAGNINVNLPSLAGTLIGTGDTGSVASGMIADDAVTFAKMQNVAANSLLVRDANSSGALSELAVADTKIVIGDGTGFGAFALSGDVTMTNGGVVTIANDAVEQAMIADDAVGADQLASNAVVNASVASGAAIAFSKMENLTASRALASDSNGDVSVTAVTAAELGLLDGGTSIGTTAVSDGHGILMNHGGTMAQTTVQTLAAYLDDEITAMPNLVTTAATTVGALDSGSITSGFGNINNGSSTITTTGAITGGSLVADNITIDTSTISSTNSNGNIVLDPNGVGTVDMSSARVTSVADPTGAQDAATKAYVDAVKTGLDVKDSVSVASTADLSTFTYNNGAGTLTAPSAAATTIDGVTLTANMRVLIKDQDPGTENGIYKVTTAGSGTDTTVLTRADDANVAAELTGGTFVFVEQGTTNGDAGFVFTHNGTPTIGTTALTVTQFSGAGSITAGDGLGQSGTTLSVSVDDSSIEINSDTLRVKALGITNAMLAGSIALGSKVTGTLPIANGGTGLSSYTAGDMVYYASSTSFTKLGIGGDGTFLTSDGSAPSWTSTIDGGTF